MARLKLSEFKSKTLLVQPYGGVSLSLSSAEHDIAQLDQAKRYIVKVDQGVKKRGKQGLLKLNVTAENVASAVDELGQKGFERFIAEEMFEHDENEEQYVSFERTREGIQIMHSPSGGVLVEDNPNSVTQYTPETVPLPQAFVEYVVNVMNEQHMSFVEINPLIVREDECTLLDAAVLVDSAGEHVANWTDEDVVEARTLTESEAAVAELNDNSPAAFSFRILNPNGSLWLLLSGGGASITIADEAMNQGRADAIGNYGEYSGGPSTEETYLYTKQVLAQVFLSDVPKKAIVIAGGVANFTDVKKTFKGLIQALDEIKKGLSEHKVRVFVRRGGPNETEGLKLMTDFLKDNDMHGSVHGSDVVLTDVVNEALEYVDA